MAGGVGRTEGREGSAGRASASPGARFRSALCRGRIAVRREPWAGPEGPAGAASGTRTDPRPSPTGAAAVLPPAPALRHPHRAQPQWTSGLGLLRAPTSSSA